MGRKISEERKIIHDQWRQRITLWKRSGQSQTQFCIEQELSLRSFQYWRRKFKKQQSSIVAKPNDRSVKIVQVDQGQFFKSHFQSSISMSMRINIRDMSIDLANSFNDEALSRLIRVLRTA